MQFNGGQLFTYIEQEKDIEFVCLYASDFDEKTKERSIEQRIISHQDNKKILDEDPKLKSLQDAKNVKERFRYGKILTFWSLPKKAFLKIIFNLIQPNL
jgi:hypothetical protein